MPTGMKVLVGGLLTIIVVTLVLGIAGYDGAAWLVGNLGTLVFMAGMVMYIVLGPSKKRWPSKKPFDRFASVITFDSSTEKPNG